jgi:BASS family bile acid:Na+ symporter
MTPAEIIILVLRASVIAMVFAIGLNVALSDLTLLIVRRPGLLLRSLVSLFLVMLLAATGLAVVADLRRPVAIVIVALALAPIPPLLPKKQAKAGGESDYIYGLLVAAAVFAIIWIPLAIEFVSWASGAQLSAHLPDVIGVVFMMLLAPLATGALVARFAPAFAARIRTPIARLASLVLLAGLALMIFRVSGAILDLIGNGTLAAMTAFVVVGIVSGELLGGPRPEDRSVLALATASRHPGVTYALATLNFPQEKSVPAAVLLYLLVGAILTLPYVAWRRRAGAASLLQA